jgi:hypothetical protein
MNEVQQILHEAHNLIERGGWVQGMMAADAAGNPAGHLTDEGAVKFCVWGAICHVCHVLNLDRASTKIGDLITDIIFKRTGRPLSVGKFNDDILTSEEEALDFLCELERVAADA